MPMIRQSCRIFAVAAVLIAAVAGCNQTGHVERDAIVSYGVGDYARGEAMLKGPAEKKDENYVLNNYRLGSCALASGDLETAEHAFFNAYQVINSGDVNDPGRAFSATVVFEGVKVFKGEPFERAMAHYYLGMIYLLKNDYGNARAAFQNSLFQVREYAKKDDLDHYKAVESKFALGYFGLGFTNLRLNRSDLAQQNFELAQKYDPRMAGLIADVQRPGVNTLIFIDAGRGPQKSPKGWYNEESVFGPTPAEAGSVPPIQAYVDGQPVTRQEPYDAVDTLALAQERSWQDIDTLRKVKAVVGTGAMAAGAGMTAYGASEHKDAMTWAGVGTMLVGAALAASSQADLRYWELLPRTVYIVPASLSPGQHSILVQAGAGRNELHTAVPAGPGDHVFYFRLH